MLTFEIFEQELFPIIRDLCSPKHNVSFTNNSITGRWTGVIYFQELCVEIFYVRGGCSAPYNIRKVDFDRILICRDTILEHNLSVTISRFNSPIIINDIARYLIGLIDSTIKFPIEKSDFRSREIELTLIGKKK